jgi:hypothetical protein
MNTEDLPNGIHLRMERNNTNHYGDESFHDDWVASIKLKNWYYCKGGSTRESAIENLYRHIQEKIQEYQTNLKFTQERLDEAVEFLKTHETSNV